MRPSRCCSSVNETLKSRLKSLPKEDAHGKCPAHSPLEGLQLRQRRPGHRPEHHIVIRQVDAKPLKPSAIDEQDGHPAV